MERRTPCPCASDCRRGSASWQNNRRRRRCWNWLSELSAWASILSGPVYQRNRRPQGGTGRLQGDAGRVPYHDGRHSLSSALPSCAFSPFRRRLRASATATTAWVVSPDRRSLRELAAPRQLLGDIPRHPTVVRRIKIGPLQRRHGAIEGALAPTGDARERVFGSAAESFSVWRGERASKAGNDLLGIDIVSGHGRWLHSVTG